MGDQKTLITILIVLVILIVLYMAYERCYLNTVLPKAWEPKICKI